MTKRYHRKLAVLAKIETTYGTDATPTGAANAMQMSNVSIEPFAGDEVSRDLMRTFLGHQGVILVGSYVKIEGEVELAGSGAAGTAPAWGPLMRMSGMSETISAGVSVAYAPVSAGYESGSVYFNQDGVNHIALGTRSNVTLSLVPKQIPRLKFSMMGLLGTIADTALPSADLSAFTLPVPVSEAMTTLALHGKSNLISESISLDLGQKVEPRFLIGSEGMEITDRQATGQVVLEADTLANADWFSIAAAETRAAMEIVHGTTAGNIVTIGAPKVQIGRPTQGQTQDIVNYTLPLMLTPDAGNDELTLTLT
ncbi:MAG: hypothetical protein GC202_14260 [Alphaproteobacteria bacterium]|nr:hypothetical protein [Alphaproteobacteria bacterium]